MPNYALDEVIGSASSRGMPSFRLGVVKFIDSSDQNEAALDWAIAELLT